MAKSIEAVTQDIERGFDQLIRNRDAFEIPTLKELEGSTKQRIHNKGKASDERTLIGKKYSARYEQQKRKIFGNNVYPINWELTSDLRRSFTVGKKNGRNVLWFQDEKNRKKAGYLEERYKKEVYKPSSLQHKNAQAVLRESIRRAAINAMNP